MQKISFEVNGKSVNVEVHPFSRLLDVLRNELELTGTKEGCGEGECGACSVFIDGILVNSCLVPTSQVQDCKVETIENIAQDNELHTVQQAFIETGGAQCGICTPGMIMATINILRSHPQASDNEIREGLAGNFCRCTGYTKIIDAVKKSIEEKKDESVSS
ncbi:(2Fe-2S)-binding protein [Candidatus Uabimicrobium amorphum]|uniref:(2Fe-2S)-binding protein n=1 Tax=Uabimicrobium amorphum TaxID=2596890 RepID=A0A5S9ILP4_UABAM|nr:(2Fe-2S)-binding protein [Candidatus Uabimicrobium amorphum]BBM83632.1 (2Fe-2S)-binding protein [Candidatus Uabimicrobium amorphum]